MEVILAKTAGFCFGVKRAVDKVYEWAEGGRQIYTLGPIIHNDIVVKDLEARHVITLKDETELDRVCKDGVLIVRSHGVGKDIIEKIEKRGIEYVDMTCPFVKRIHNTVSEKSSTDSIIIAGSKDHPEVIGINGWCGQKAYIVENLEELTKVSNIAEKPVTMVSQTTFNYNKFQEFVEMFEKIGYDVNVVNTICDATRNRQCEAADIATQVDDMIVIGDRNSSNSRKLYDICSKACKNTYFIQDLSDLIEQLQNRSMPGNIVGITAGASTPNNIIREVQNYVRTNF